MRSAGRGAAQSSVTRSRLNHISVEEAQEAPDVVVGEFLVHSHLATVLFDSGATYSFVSSTFASTHSLPTSLLAIPTLTPKSSARFTIVLLSSKCRLTTSANGEPLSVCRGWATVV